ncbi:MAG: hypothetical protein HY321_02995 [Armatimonadetes bacterium]|nr:hypothetical protein [Armatimonadota bacterium]
MPGRAIGRRVLIRASLLLVVGAPGARAQLGWRPPAEVTSVEVEELSNAVRVTLRSDGTMRLSFRSLLERGSQRGTDGGIEWLPVRRVPFRLHNCRSKVGAFHNVSRYPISHLEMSTPADDPLGTTLDVEVVLFREAVLESIWFNVSRFSWGRAKGLGMDLTLSPDGRSISLTVESDRFPLRPVERVLPGPERPETLRVAAQDGRLSATARYVPLSRLLAAVGGRVGERVLLEEGVERTVSLHLEDTPLPDFLRAVTVAYGLSLGRAGNTWMVGEGVAAAPTSYLPSETRRFPLRYLSPSDALDLLPNFLIAHVHVDAGGSALVASGPETVLNKIAADLRKIDVPPPHVQVEGIAVEYTSEQELVRAFGADATAGRARIAAVPGDASVTLRVLGAPPPEWRARVTALAKRGALRVRAEPRATVLNGQTASLFVGRERYVQAYRRSWRGLEGEVRSVPVGVTLDVTPWTGGEEITLSVKPAITTIDEIDPATRLPVVGVRSTAATVRIRSGDTLLVSGLGLSQADVGARKLPLLGDLPVVGALFRSRRGSRSRSDLAVFVTARIL